MFTLSSRGDTGLPYLLVADHRGSDTTDVDENRLIIAYTFKFW
ncbi:hypothetical protein [Pseudomonas sp. NPDC087336]